MTKYAVIVGAALLAVVIGLSIWVGRLRSEVRDGEKLLAQITAQRDDAIERARTSYEESVLAGEKAAESDARKVEVKKDLEVVEGLLVSSRERVRSLQAKRIPASVPECMERLRTMSQHVALVEDTLRLKTDELRWTEQSLVARSHQVSMLEISVSEYREALRLEGARIDASRSVEKKRKKKRIVGFTVGALVIAAGGIASGVAIGKSG